MGAVLGKIGVGMQETRQKRTLLIVDDSLIVRMALRRYIEDEPDIAVCGEAGDEAGAIELLTKARPDVVVLDLFLGRASGLDVLKRALSVFPNMPVLMMSGESDPEIAAKCLSAGARGYLSKSGDLVNIGEAVGAVLAGNTYLGRSQSGRREVGSA